MNDTALVTNVENSLLFKVINSSNQAKTDGGWRITKFEIVVDIIKFDN